MRFVMMLLAALGLFAVQPAQASVILSGSAEETVRLDETMEWSKLFISVTTSAPTTLSGLYWMEMGEGGCSYIPFFYCDGNEFLVSQYFSSPAGTHHELTIGYAPVFRGNKYYLSIYDLGPVFFDLVAPGGESFDYRAMIIPVGVPEPATWALFILGFGVVAAAMRRRPVKAPLSA